jgi:hypothetical protein
MTFAAEEFGASCAHLNSFGPVESRDFVLVGGHRGEATKLETFRPAVSEAQFWKAALPRCEVLIFAVHEGPEACEPAGRSACLSQHTKMKCFQVVSQMDAGRISLRLWFKGCVACDGAWPIC